MSAQFDPSVDHYGVLGVKSDASAEEIKKTYRRLAKKYHPDSTGGDKSKETRFKQISSAYDVVGDAEKRAQYDAMRNGGYSPFGGQQGRPQGFDGFAPGQGFGGGGIGDILGQMFGGMGGNGGNVRWTHSSGGQADPFAQPRSRRRRPAPAPGRGAERVRKVKAADGSWLTQRGKHVNSDVRVDIDQAVLGTVVQVPTLEGSVKTKVPPGTSSGTKLRLKGKGPVGPGGKRGDHFITVHIDVPKDLDEKSKKLLAQFMRRARTK